MQFFKHYYWLELRSEVLTLQWNVHLTSGLLHYSTLCASTVRGNDAPMTRWCAATKLMGNNFANNMMSEFPNKKINMRLPQHITLCLKGKALQARVDSMCQYSTIYWDWDRDTGSLWRVVWIVNQKRPKNCGSIYITYCTHHQLHGDLMYSTLYYMLHVS